MGPLERGLLIADALVAHVGRVADHEVEAVLGAEDLGEDDADVEVDGVAQGLLGIGEACRDLPVDLGPKAGLGLAGSVAEK